MRAVGVRDFRNKLSEYLRAVEEGEIVLVTKHEVVIASLQPPPRVQRVVDEDVDAALDRLARAGFIRRSRGRGGLSSLRKPKLKVPKGFPSAQQLIDASRQETDPA